MVTPAKYKISFAFTADTKSAGEAISVMTKHLEGTKIGVESVVQSLDTVAKVSNVVFTASSNNLKKLQKEFSSTERLFKSAEELIKADKIIANPETGEAGKIDRLRKTKDEAISYSNIQKELLKKANKDLSDYSKTLSIKDDPILIRQRKLTEELIKITQERDAKLNNYTLQAKAGEISDKQAAARANISIEKYKRDIKKVLDAKKAIDDEVEAKEEAKARSKSIIAYNKEAYATQVKDEKARRDENKKQLERNLTRSLAAYKAEQEILLSTTKETNQEESKLLKFYLAQDEANRKASSDKIIQLKVNEAEQIRQIYKRLAEEQEKLEKRFLEGKLKEKTFQYGMERLTNIASTEINAAKQPRYQKEDEIAVARKNAEELQKLEDSNLAQIRRNVEEARLLKTKGANSAQYILAIAANKEALIWENLAKKEKQIIQAVLDEKIKRNQAELILANERAKAEKELLSIQQGLPDFVKRASGGVQTLNQHFSRLVKHITEVYVVWGTLNAVTSRFREAVYGVIPVGIAFDSVRASLESTTGSFARTEAILRGLSEESKRTGIEIGQMRTNFASFQASTSLAGASLEETWRMFSNLNTVITALHKTSDEANHIFLAMAQIFNKSKVQSEELVKQLGNLLPGAFASFAASMGIQTEELSARMKKGIVKAQDTMEEFAKYMATRFAASFALASTMLNADINRMQSSFTLLGEAIYASSNSGIQSFVKNITKLSDYLKDAVEGVNNFGKIVGEVFKTVFIAGTVVLARYTTGLISAKLATISLAEATALLTKNKLSIALIGISEGLSRIKLASDDAKDSLENLSDIAKTFNEKVLELSNKDTTIPIEVRVENSKEIQNLDKELLNLRSGFDKLDKYQDYFKEHLFKQEGYKKAIEELILTTDDGFKIIKTAKERELFFDKLTYGQKVELVKKMEDRITEIRKKAIEDRTAQEKEAIAKEIQARYESLPKLQEAMAAQTKIGLLEATGQNAEAKRENIAQKHANNIDEYIRIIQKNKEELADKTKEYTAEQRTTMEKQVLEARELVESEFIQQQAAFERLNAENEKRISEISTRNFKTIQDEEVKRIKSLFEVKLNELDNQAKVLKAKENELGFKEYNAQMEQIINRKLELQKQETALLIKNREALAGNTAEMLKYYNIVDRMSQDDIFRGIIGTESGGKKGLTSSAGAIGTPQIKPSTYEATRLAHPELGISVSANTATDEQLVIVAKAHYADLTKIFKDNVSAIFAYFKGEGAARSKFKSAGVSVGTQDENELFKVHSEMMKQTAIFSSTGKKLDLSFNEYLSNVSKRGGFKTDFSSQQNLFLKSQGDVSDLQNESIKNAQDAQAALDALSAQAVVNLEKYRELQNEIEYKWLESQGRQDEADSKRFQLEWDRKQKLLDPSYQIKSENISAEQTKNRIKDIIEFEKSAQSLKRINKDIDTAQLALKEKEYTLELQLKAGNIDQVTFSKLLFEERQKTVEEINKQLDLEEKLNLTATQRLQLERQRLEVQKTNTDKVGSAQSILQRQVGDSNVASGFGGALTQFRADQGNLQSGRDQEENVAASSFKSVVDKEQQLLLLGERTKQEIQANSLAAYEKYAQEKSDIDLRYNSASIKSYTDGAASMLSVGANTFQTLTDFNVRMHGAQSKEAKKSFAAWKAMKTAEVIMSTASASLNAFNSGLQLGGPFGMAVGVAFAAIAAAMGAVQIAQVQNTQLPAAHGGLTEVPKEQTYLLDKGERVLSPNQNTDLVRFMQNQTQGNKNSLTNPKNNIKIVNTFDKSVTLDHLGSNEAEEVIMNIVYRNLAA